VYRPEIDAVAVPAGRWLDHHLFFAVLARLFDPAVMGAGASTLGGREAVAAFMKDREPMLATARVKPPELDVARVVLDNVLGSLDAQLAAGGPFVFGASVGWADFCAYHSLWMMQANAVLAPELETYPFVSAWMDRIRAFGHGEAKPLASHDSLEIARAGAPRPAVSLALPPPGGLALGDEVEIAADDYAFEPSAGRLVHVGPDELAIARTDQRAGHVIVHFPRIGYQVKRVG